MLTYARMRDEVARRTGYRPDVVAHVLDKLEEVVRAELLQQGEVVFRGLFRITPGRRMFYSAYWSTGARVERIVLSVKPVRAFRSALSRVLPR